MTLHTQAPDFQGWSGTIKTRMEIGQGALVEIEATIDDGDTQAVKVIFMGVDIADALGNEGLAEIDRHIAKHWQKLTQAADADMAEAA